MASAMVVEFVMVTLGGGLLEGPVHSLNLPVGLLVAPLGQSMIDLTFGVGEFEAARPEWLGICDPDIDGGGEDISGSCKVGAVVSQDGVDLIGHSLDEGAEDVAGDLLGGLRPCTP